MTYLKRSITVLSISLLLVFSALAIADTNKPDLVKNSSMYSSMASDSLPAGDWDIDDNGQADALTDGLMFLR